MHGRQNLCHFYAEVYGSGSYARFKEAIDGLDLNAYKDNLEERFRNPNIRDQVSRICAQSSAKLPKFLIPTIIENLASGGSIKYGTFVLAAWCYYSDKGIDSRNNPIEIIDDRKAELHERAKKYEAG